MPLSFRLTTIFYVMALLAAALAAFGPWGILAAVWVLLIWMFVHAKRWSGIYGIFILGLTWGVVAWTWSILSATRTPSSRSICTSHLRQIALALENYHYVHGSYPPPYLTDAHGEPAHSWRVLILPFLEEHDLYRQYRFDEPWDGPNNRKLVEYMPYIYRCSGMHGGMNRYQSDYLAIVGENTAWRTDRPRTQSDFVDGLENTLLVIESCGNAVNWMEPKDLTYDEALKQLTTATYNGHLGYYSESHACFADGHVALVWPYGRNDVATAILTVNGKEPIDESLFVTNAEEHLRVRETNYRPNYYAEYFPTILFIALAILPAFRLNRPPAPPPARESSP